MSNVDLAFLQREVKRLHGRGDNGGDGNHTGGNPPGGDELEKRVEALEKALPDIRERLVRIETRLESVERHGATKADLESLKADLSTRIETMGRMMIQWSIGTALVLTGIAFTAARFIPGA